MAKCALGPCLLPIDASRVVGTAAMSQYGIINLPLIAPCPILIDTKSAPNLSNNSLTSSARTKSACYHQPGNKACQKKPRPYEKQSWEGKRTILITWQKKCDVKKKSSCLHQNYHHLHDQHWSFQQVK
nr:hypothetical protein Iba_chr15fCG4930 [Ipomoea batatas]